MFCTPRSDVRRDFTAIVDFVLLVTGAEAEPMIPTQSSYCVVHCGLVELASSRTSAGMAKEITFVTESNDRELTVPEAVESHPTTTPINIFSERYESSVMLSLALNDVTTSTLFSVKAVKEMIVEGNHDAMLLAIVC